MVINLTTNPQTCTTRSVDLLQFINRKSVKNKIIATEMEEFLKYLFMGLKRQMQQGWSAEFQFYSEPCRVYSPTMYNR